MATIFQFNVIVDDGGTPALTQDEAMAVMRKLIQVLEVHKLTAVFAASAPHAIITVK